MKKKITMIICLTLTICIAALCGCSNSANDQKTITVINYGMYIDPAILDQFTEETGIVVLYEEASTPEELYSKYSSGAIHYDAVCSSEYIIMKMMADQSLQPIDFTQFEHIDNISDDVWSFCATFDEGNQYALPYFWGTAGLVYNKKHISDEFMKNPSWHMLSHEQFLGKDVITMLDDPREVIGSALVCLGFDANDTSDEALLKARELLLKWDKNITQYDSDSFKNEIQDGTTWIAHSYNGDALQIMEENSEIGFVLPVEGSTLWIDSMVILKNAENKDMAYEFIDFILAIFFEMAELLH
ncbi:MAG TPA: spermidine/putrescine ABC transporter substrate-binding protein [Lachnospiraceae bacterium]|nr:spermidine/putrescine ABC transporter substrate-binding protein [Lachnospiraceae bacterium]